MAIKNELIDNAGDANMGILTTKNGPIGSGQWLPVVGYEGIYDINGIGDVKRVGPGPGVRVGRILKQTTNNCGYKTVHLSHNGETQILKVHSMVANAFIGPRPEGKQVNHIDGNKMNNSAENLEYLTPSENIYHAYANGFMSQLGENHNQSKLTEDGVCEIRLCAGSETQKSLADRFGVSQSAISMVISGKRWGHLK